MSDQKATTNEVANTVQIPEWENAAIGKDANGSATHARPTRSAKAAFTGRLDSVLPPHKRYLGRSRKTFLWVLLAVTLALLALIIGLAIGLTKRASYATYISQCTTNADPRHSGSQNLPLPSNSQNFVGDLTYYGTGLGACGITSGNDDSIVAISHIVFDAVPDGGDPNANPLCGRYVRAARFDEEVGARRSIDLKVVDRCTGCKADDLDTSLGAFEKLAPSASGRVDVTWAWLPAGATKI